MRDYQNTRELLPRDHERVFDAMTSRDRWTEPFERARPQVRAVAYRMLGSLKRRRGCGAGGVSAAEPHRNRSRVEHRRVVNHRGRERRSCWWPLMTRLANR